MEDIDKWFVLLGLKLVNVVVAAVTSFAALRFFDGLSTREKWATFLGGWAIAAWGAAPLREYLELRAGVEVGLVLLLGLFGMALAAQVVAFIRDTDFKALLLKALGRGQ